MVNPQHLRPGNWIYPTGRSKYVVVTGLLLGMMEKNADLCKEFEVIELTGELLEAAGFKFNKGDAQKFESDFIGLVKSTDYPGRFIVLGILKQTGTQKCLYIDHLHQLQNLYFLLSGAELPLPESALIIPQTLEK